MGKAMAKEKSYVSCVRLISKVPGGKPTIAYLANGKLLARVYEPGYSGVIDMREEQFLALSPCPYCGVFKDRGHNAMMHIDKRKGE